MSQLTILSALTLGAPFAQLEPKWRALHPDIALDFHWHPSTVIAQQVAAGVAADAIVATIETQAQLEREGFLQADSVTDLVDSPIGFAVLPGVTPPDISTPEAVKQTLLAARSVAWSAGGASGIYFAELLNQLGIDAEVRARGTIIRAGYTAEQLHNGAADIALQQISELLMVPNIQIVGALPAPLQQPVSLAGSVLQTSNNAVAAQQFLHWLQTPEVFAVFSQYGLTKRY